MLKQSFSVCDKWYDFPTWREASSVHLAASNGSKAQSLAVVEELQLDGDQRHHDHYYGACNVCE